MTAAEYRRTIAELGFKTQLEAAHYLGVKPRTAQNYAVHGPSEPVARLIRLIHRKRIPIQELLR